VENDYDYYSEVQRNREIVEKDYDDCFEEYQEAKNEYKHTPKNGLRKTFATILSVAQRLKPSSTSSSSRIFQINDF